MIFVHNLLHDPSRVWHPDCQGTGDFTSDKSFSANRAWLNNTYAGRGLQPRPQRLSKRRTHPTFAKGD
jgi:hypothetical protein